MNAVVKRRAHRERLALNTSDMATQQTHHGSQIVSPAITARPELDSMMADMSFIAKRLLEAIRNKMLDNPAFIPDREELRSYKEICETVTRQAKTEMELEKHASQRTSAMTTEEIQTTIQSALQRSGVEPQVIEIVLTALGMSIPKNE